MDHNLYFGAALSKIAPFYSLDGPLANLSKILDWALPPHRISFQMEVWPSTACVSRATLMYLNMCVMSTQDSWFHKRSSYDIS